MELSASVSIHAEQAHLVVAGELDASTALRVRRRLVDALAQGCTRFTVDASGLAFIDAAGLSVFVRLLNAATQRGGSVTFTAASTPVRRACEAAGLSQAFRFATADDGGPAAGLALPGARS